MPFTDIDYDVKSIAVPDGQTVYLYNNPCFNGESAEVSASIECMDTGSVTANFNLLGVTIMEEKEIMKKAPGGKQVRYKKPSVVRAESLKKFKTSML